MTPIRQRHRAAPRVPTGLVALIFVGCGSASPPRPYYDSTGFQQAPAATGQRGALAATVRARLKGRTVSVRERGAVRLVAPAKFDELSVAVLQALLVVGDDDRRGAEADLLIPVRGEGTYPVSVVIETGGALIAELGPRVKWATPRGEGDLRAQFGTGPLQQTGRSHWDEPSRLALQTALERLSATERKLLVAMPFVRAPNGVPRERAGQHVLRNCGERLFVYDRAFQSQGVQFVGRPDAPLPASALTVLHELGHALHSRPGRLAFCAYEKRHAALEATLAAFNGKVKRVNQLGRQGKRAEAEKLGQAMERDRARIQSENAQLSKLADRAAALVRSGPVLAAYNKALGGRPAPTRYGEVSVQESFAESFALYHADPDALGRVLPGVLEWFQAGGHLKALE